MSEHSRRSFLKTASIGAAAAGATAALPALSSAADAAPATESGPAHEGAFTVWVKDARTGELSFLAGETEVVHHDKALATKLARIAARGTKA